MTAYNFTLHYTGILPKTVVIGQVRTEAIEGDYTLNPLYFEHFDINKLCLRVNGRSVPSDPLQPDFTNVPPLVAREYQHMFLNTGKWRVNESNCINMGQFHDGCTLFPFDLTPDQCNGTHIHRGTEGVINVEMSWSSALLHAITIITECCYDEMKILESIHNAPQVVEL